MKGLLSSLAGAALVSASLVVTLSAQYDRAEVALRAAIETQTVRGDLRAAIAQYKVVIQQHAGNRSLTAQALLRMAECYRLLGDPEADTVLQRLVGEYGDQQQVAAEARRRLEVPPSTTDRGTYVQREIWSGPDLMTRLAPNPAVGFRARPSADGRWLAYVDWTSHGNVALRNVASGEIRLITKDARAASAIGAADAAMAFHPRLSPDGSQVAYQWAAGGDYSYSIRVASASGGRPKVLLQRGLYASDIAWAPDGRALAVIVAQAQGGTDPHIAIISVSDGSIARLKSLPYRPGYHGRNAELGGFSPDGRHLLYAVPNEAADQGGIFAIARDGSFEAALVRGRSNDMSPVWAPGGGAVVFVSDRSTNNGLWSLKVANGRPVGAPELLRGNVGPMQALGFARDGSLFYGLMTSEEDALVAEFALHGPSVGAPVLLVEGGVGANRGASWSPDGRFLAFVRSNGSEETVIVRRPDGSEQRLTTKFNGGGYRFAMPSWLPDSRSLLVPDIDRTKRRSVFRKVSTETLQETVVLEGPNWDMRRVTGPSPDGKYLYYSKGERITVERPQTVRLVRRDLETGEELELHRTEFGGSPAFYSVAISPDGSRVAFTAFNEKQERALMMVSSAGGAAPREIAHGDFLPAAGDPDQTLQWSRDGRLVLVVTAERGDNRRVWAVPAEGGEPTRLDLSGAHLRLTDLSPDGRRVALSQHILRPEIGVVQNLLGLVRGSK